MNSLVVRQITLSTYLLLPRQGLPLPVQRLIKLFLPSLSMSPLVTSPKLASGRLTVNVQGPFSPHVGLEVLTAVITGCSALYFGEPGVSEQNIVSIFRFRE